eukprot:760090-Alexandrium_andersonii.AAC.1
MWVVACCPRVVVLMCLDAPTLSLTRNCHAWSCTCNPAAVHMPVPGIGYPLACSVLVRCALYM